MFVLLQGWVGTANLTKLSETFPDPAPLSVPKRPLEFLSVFYRFFKHFISFLSVRAFREPLRTLDPKNFECKVSISVLKIF